ncbi:4-hydroxy-3-methylbut-2-enyl diphosphate reductase [Nocardia sp. NPDC050712]|uniref:4-hydroxy-3-methylbut-2-enyl diphosphate reductase n=1 Tax=Nocardia sp. NPDC050712 TaxID=3155518 RepID=UPI0033FBE089
MDSTVVLAAPRSFCAGVERAIETVERLLAQHGAPIYVRKQIVHNTFVVNELHARGAIFVDELDEVPAGSRVVFSAHGVAPAVRAAAAARGLQVVDATCPLVAKVHAEATRFAAHGDTILLIGHAGHEETEGTLGVAPDSTILVQNVEDAARVEIPEGAQLSYLTQTTLAVDETAEIVAVLRRRFPQLKDPPSDDICYATTNRQNAVRAILDDIDLLLVIGSVNSSNSRRLVDIAVRAGTAAYLIDGPQDIDPRWLEDATAVGVTAGASAPPRLVDDVLALLAEAGADYVVERETTTETIRFMLPLPVRAPVDPTAARKAEEP